MSGWAAAAAIATIAGTGYSVYSQEQAKKESKQAQEEQDRKDAWDQMIAAAGGDPIPQSSPVRIQPTVDYGAAIANVGSTIGSYGAAKVAAAKEATALQKADQQQITLNAIQKQNADAATATSDAAKVRADAFANKSAQGPTAGEKIKNYEFESLSAMTPKGRSNALYPPPSTGPTTESAYIAGLLVKQAEGTLSPVQQAQLQAKGINVTGPDPRGVFTGTPAAGAPPTWLTPYYTLGNGH